MCREGSTRWMRVAGVLLALTLLTPAWAAAQQEKGQEEKQPPPKDQAAAAAEQKPKVFTNADLAKYGKAKPAKPAATAEPPAEGFPEPESPGEAPPAAKLAPEDRPDDATVPELQERERELAAQLAYLKAKLSWLRNPLLPQPTPPEGEALLDPDLSGGEEFRRTQSLLNETENRLFTTRATLSALGVAVSPER